MSESPEVVFGNSPEFIIGHDGKGNTILFKVLVYAPDNDGHEYLLLEYPNKSKNIFKFVENRTQIKRIDNPIEREYVFNHLTVSLKLIEKELKHRGVL